ncbi:hypothetical protein NQ314_015823 [Rhamnusium bicolor]|uniref:Nuclease HARBI1 n=1 Tax=Rhamnusium bicolor TaxID=1586634 RepID=A0AAV8WYD1_9CUCU|nr:hypothetical protein NQ314_015823 [Rhamnusium bicolor]
MCSRRLQMSPEHIDNVILATCCLHNFLRGNSHAIEIDPSNNNQQTNNVSTIQDLRNVGGKATEEALHIREEFKNYFCTTGVVDWQTDMIRRGYTNQ